MDKKIRINIQVGESIYPLWVEPKEEPLFREAARMVNRRLIAYSTKFRGANLPSERVMAMAAIDLAVLCQKQGDNANLEATEANLANIVADLQEFLGEDATQS
ncbi:MAG: cell division protein ZapA [Bacteroidales bacterium]|nr:cell division protein ZapA [Bacteroidales bacterium]